MNRLVCLDGLRGILATYVLLGHMAPFAVLPDLLQQAVSHGAAAVERLWEACQVPDYRKLSPAAQTKR